MHPLGRNELHILASEVQGDSKYALQASAIYKCYANFYNVYYKTESFDINVIDKLREKYGYE